MRGVGKRLFKLRKRSSFTQAGFIGGVIAGVIFSIFAEVVMFVNKARFFKELKIALESMKYKVPLPLEKIWLLSVISTPIGVILLYSITGMILGLVIEKLKYKSSFIVLFLNILIGIFWGLTTNLPIDRIPILIATFISWLIAGIFQAYGIKKQNN